ncbi:FliM/FliN family flagellar motor switch protein [Pseudomonas asuensis]|uniref:Type III secretion protein HrcQb n=1 Tax=Pseudomonas asuensis TaxID=1825787 RepID=A0ABQ2H4W3_9PSED|nr:FliM/FliN family flagellar motor switch protein [Pseudomonas asuensis]GGM31089.1 type III secretion protein HrcQb [Pseudomonas asuensis]
MSSTDHYTEAELDEPATLESDESYERELDEEQDDFEDSAEINDSAITALEDESHVYRSDELESLERLPLELSLRCGRLTLSLDALQRLGSGTVLEVGGIAPGQATLCYGEQVVAEGELVDVDGRLGLQITRTASKP